MLNIEKAAPFRMNVIIEGLERDAEPVFSFGVTDEAGLQVFGYHKRLSRVDGGYDTLSPGEQIQISVEVNNILKPGRYFLSARGFRDDSLNDMRMQVLRAIDWVIFGTGVDPGAVTLVDEVEVTRPED